MKRILHNKSTVPFGIGQTRWTKNALNKSYPCKCKEVIIFDYTSRLFTQLGSDIIPDTNLPSLDTNISLLNASSIAITGHSSIFSQYTVAVGFPGYESGDSHGGYVYVYTFEGNNWISRGSTLSGGEEYDQLGSAVAISQDGKRLVATSTLNNNVSPLPASAKTYIRTYSYNIYTQDWEILNELSSTSNKYGQQLALNRAGTFLAVSDISTNVVDYSSVNIYKLYNNKWQLLGNKIVSSYLNYYNIDGDIVSDGFGTSISLSDDGYTLVIGSPTWNANGDNENEGKFYVYNYNSLCRSWDLVFEKEGNNLYGQLGASVSLNGNGNILAVSEPEADRDGGLTQKGLVTIYQLDGWTKKWNQLGLAIQGDQNGSFMGSEPNSVKLNEKGDIVSITSLSNNNKVVEVYQYINNNWSQIGSDILHTTANNATFGSCISLSNDGKSVAIGDSAGIAQIYAFN